MEQERMALSAKEREHRLEQILSVREPPSVAADYTVRWQGQVWAIPRAEVRAGLRGARVEVERRLDGSLWARFRGAYLSLSAAATPPPRPASPFGLRPPGLAAKTKARTKTKYLPPPDHPWRRTFLSGKKPDISILR